MYVCMYVGMSVCDGLPKSLCTRIIEIPSSGKSSGDLPETFRKHRFFAVALLGHLLARWRGMFFQFPTPVDLGVAAGGCSSGNLPEIFRKSSGISGDAFGGGGALCGFALPGNLPGTFRKPSGTMRFLEFAISSGKPSGNLPETFRNHAFSNTSRCT